MRRSAPRRLERAVDRVKRTATPATALAGVQEQWDLVVGPAVARVAQPVGERRGAVTIVCDSASWAQELELQAPELLRRLNGALAESGRAAVPELRFRVGRGG